MTRRMPSGASVARWFALALGTALFACGIDDFFFAGRPAEDFHFDEADPALDGDLSAPHASSIPPGLRDEGLLESDGDTPLHWVFARQPIQPATTILFFHGNGPHLGRFWDRVEVLHGMGYQVLIYDYPGYGRSHGTASEAALERSGMRMLEALLARPEVDAERVLLYGHSLGAAVAFATAAASESGALVSAPGFRPQGLITESGWCSVAEMIRDAAFLDVPVETLSRLRFDSCAHLARLHATPVMLLHGRADRIVPLRQHQLLAHAASAARVPAPTLHTNAAGHVDVMVVGGPGPDARGVARPSEAFRGWLADFEARTQP